jgi:AI-2 transport protein TqsA
MIRGGRMPMDKDRLRKIADAVIIVFLFGVFLKLAKPALIPFCLALFLSFALTPALDFLVSWKVPRSIAMAAILLLTFVVLYLMGAVLYASGKQFATELPSNNEMLKSLLDGMDQTIKNPRLKAEALSWLNNLNGEKIGSFILSALGPFLSFMSELLLIFVFMIFILGGRGRMEKKIAQAFSPEQASTVAQAMRNIDHQVQRYLAVQILVCLVTGALTTVVLALFHLPFAIVFGVLAFVLNFIPTLGSIIATALPVLLATFFFGNLGPVVGILVLLIAINFVLGNFVQPRLMGKGLGLSPLLVFFSLFFGFWLWGIPGMILAVPILAVIKIIISNVPSLKSLEAMMG